MNAQRRIFLLISLVAAIGIALLVFALLRNSKPQAIVMQQPVASQHVLTAKDDIKAGTPLTADMVHWQSWPGERTRDGYITDKGGKEINRHIAGTVARGNILEGMPIVDSMLIHTKQAGFMAATLTPGMRAMAIPVSLDRAVAGFVRPDSHVDILYARMAGNRQHVQVLLSDVRILALDQTAELGPKAPLAVKSLHTVTFELTPKQANILTEAHLSGNLSLTLRPLPRNGTSGPIQIIRGGPPPDMARQ